MAEIHTINVGGTNYTLSDSTKLPLIGGELTGDVYLKFDTTPTSLILNTKGGSIKAMLQDERTSYPIVYDSGGYTYFGNGGASTSLTGVSVSLTTSSGDMSLNSSGNLLLQSEGTCFVNAITNFNSGVTFSAAAKINHSLTPSTTSGNFSYISGSGTKFYYTTSGASTQNADDELLTAKLLKTNFSEEFSVLPANPTVSTSGGTYTIGTIGGKTFNISFPAWGSGSNINTDTKNTAGATNANGTKLFLIGAGTQSSNPVTYSNSGVYINSSNQLEAPAFYATSDMRLKENIKEFIPQKSILDLPIVEFDFKDTKVHQIGCLAQDLQKICPEIVNIDDKGYLSINEGKIVYLLLDEVKKLREEVNLLKGDN